MKKWYIIALLAYNFLVLFLLISGSSLLITIIPGLEAFPAGNLFTWLFMVALPLNFIVIANSKGLRPENISSKGFYMITGISLIFGVLWGIMGRLTTGNWQFNISSETSYPELRNQIFWIYSYTVPALPFLALIWLWITRLLRRKQPNQT
jgi:hypothetical protein